MVVMGGGGLQRKEYDEKRGEGGRRGGGSNGKRKRQERKRSRKERRKEGREGRKEGGRSGYRCHVLPMLFDVEGDTLFSTLADDRPFEYGGADEGGMDTSQLHLYAWKEDERQVYESN
jgi:hypothetical protein